MSGGGASPGSGAHAESRRSNNNYGVVSAHSSARVERAASPGYAPLNDVPLPNVSTDGYASVPGAVGAAGYAAAHVTLPGAAGQYGAVSADASKANYASVPGAATGYAAAHVERASEYDSVAPLDSSRSTIT
jgi:hypothetical protein